MKTLELLQKYISHPPTVNKIRLLHHDKSKCTGSLFLEQTGTEHFYHR